MSDPLARLIRDLAARSRNDPHDPEVRVAVAARAVGRCEYCLLPTGGQFQIDHIVPPRRWQEHVDGQLGVTPPIAARRGPDHRPKAHGTPWNPACRHRDGRLSA